MRANREPPGIVRRIVAALQLIVFYLASALYLPVVIAVVLTRPEGRLWRRMVRLWAGVSLAFFGIRVDTIGSENLKPGKDYVIIANHRSHFDVFALFASLADRDTQFVAKRELTRVPIFGYGLRATGQIIVDRANHEQALAELERYLGKRGISIIFFAEGQRAPTRMLLPFKKGGAAFAIDAGLPVIPIALSGSERVLPKHSLTVCPGTIRVSIGAPIELGAAKRDDHEARESLTRRVRDAIVSMLDVFEREEDAASMHAETVEAGA